jgi:L-2-hydroxyglutarate oxidase LhgO
MEKVQFDVLVIGAGVVGAATASALARKKFSVIVVEAGPRIAEGVTSRNSGVIHAGLYYPSSSVKAETCIRGKSLLYEWARAKNVPHKQIGKLIIATAESQLANLEAIYQNALASGAAGLELLSEHQIMQGEPAIKAVRAIYSKETGIVDQFELTKSFLTDAEENEAMLLLNCKVESIERTSGGYSIGSTRGPIEAGMVINAAGLASDEIAALAGVHKYKIYPCKGNYFRLRSPKHFNHLIYPVKDPASPGLGVHLTIGLDGGYRLGPDAEFVSSKEDFSEAKHKQKDFFESACKLLGAENIESVEYDTCGIRPKLRAPHEKEEKDFVVSEDLPGLINLIGIESPGLTASMAIAEKVARLASR